MRAPWRTPIDSLRLAVRVVASVAGATTLALGCSTSSSGDGGNACTFSGNEWTCPPALGGGTYPQCTPAQVGNTTGGGACQPSDMTACFSCDAAGLGGAGITCGCHASPPGDSGPAFVWVCLGTEAACIPAGDGGP